MAQSINVDMTPGLFMPTLHYSQGDIGREFVINLATRDGMTIPAGATVTMQATKPSGFGFSVAGSLSGTVATFTSTAEMTDESGRFQAEIVIAQGTTVIGTTNFWLEGEKNPHPEGTIDGSEGTIIPELTLLVERVEKAASDILDMTVEAETLAAGSQATYSYDEDTNTATFGIPQGEAGAGAAGVVASAYSSSKTYAVGDYVIHNSNLYRCTTAITTAESFTAAHWTQVVLGDDVSDLKADIAQIVSKSNILSSFEKKENIYLKTDGTEATLNGWDTYYIPVTAGDMVLIKQVSGTEHFYGTLNSDYIFHYKYDGTYTRVYVGQSGTHPNYYYRENVATYRGQFKIAVTADITEVTVTIKRGNEDLILIQKNISDKLILNDPDKVSRKNTLVTLDDNNSLVSILYKAVNMSQITANGYTIRTYQVKQGDVITIPSKATGINYFGWFFNSSTCVSSEILSSPYTAPSDGFIDTYVYSGDDIKITVKPADGIEIDYTQIKNIPDSPNPFIGLDAVAFGTSLTYRAIPNNGYLDYLPDLSGMTFDNQGVGSSEILYDLLAKIKAYTSYASKDVCTIEGFVNDWYQGNPLGTYTDTAETTVCGCVRSALNYVLSQNANITVFLILDHYGKQTVSADCRSTAVNANSQTQYEYYEEIARVAESLGIPVIKLYAVSQISENTPQYLTDNIHPTALGAEQTAYAIWSEMKTKYPNQTA